MFSWDAHTVFASSAESDSHTLFPCYTKQPVDDTYFDHIPLSEMSRRTRPSDSPNQGRHDSKLRLNWLRFGRRDKSKSKKQKRSRSRTDTGSRFTSNHGQSDANASQILANAALFPMQYHGDTYSMESFPDELIFIPFRDTDPSTQQPHHSPTHIFSADSKSRSQFKSDFKSRHKSSKLSHVHGVSALLIHGNPKNYPLSHFMILFHGNGVDLGMASTIWRPLIRSLPIHLLVVEYPGYGIMDGTCSCKEVLSVAEHVYRYVTTSRNDGGLGIPSERLIILGRSIGTGPASHIATNKCHSLILVSPFTSIHDLSSKLMGKWSTWMLPSDYGHCRRQRSESLDDLPGLLYDDNAEYNLNAQELSMSIQSIDSPIYDETVDSKAIDDDEDNHKNPMRTQSQRYLQNERNEKSLSPLSSMSTLKRSQTVSVTSKHLNLKKRAKEKQFVFNNVTQIAEWQCRNLMIFHGKSDELIPYQHTDTIIDMVQQTSFHSNSVIICFCVFSIAVQSSSVCPYHIS